MSSKEEQAAKEANFAGLCKQLYPRLEVADSVFVEALRKHGDEGLAMEEVANWQPWESQAMDPEPPKPKPKPKPEPDMDSIERQKREFEKFEKANKERLEKEKKEKAQKEREEREKKAAHARREEKARIEEQARKAEKARQEEKARLAREEEIRRAREEQAKLARLEREKAKAEEEMKARIRREIEQEEKEKREKEEKEKRQREEKDRLEREKKEKARRQKEEKAKRLKEEKERREKQEKERREKEEQERREKEEKERREKEEREKREQEEKARREQEEERIKREVRERFEKEKREKEERERIEKEEREKMEKEAKEKAEKEERERLEKEAKEKEAKEKEAKEKDDGKGKEKSEDQDIGDIIKELNDLKEMKVDFVGDNAPPRVSIYVGQESDLSAADHQKIKEAFMKKGISEHEIRILGVAADREIQQFLKTSLKKDTLAFPIVCVDGQPVGSPNDVYGLDDTQIEKLLSSTPEDPLFCTGSEASDNSEVTLGALNQVLSAGEYLASGVGSLLMLPVTALTWPFRSAPVDPNAIKGKNDVEFDVIHTNWYWRSQWRVFRFSDTFVARLHPRHRDMRAAHQYETICRLQVTDPKNIVFHYSDNSSPDYLHAKEEDVREMVKIVQSKNQDVRITKGEE